MNTHGSFYFSPSADLRTFTPSEELGTPPQVPAPRRPYPASLSVAVPLRVVTALVLRKAQHSFARSPSPSSLGLLPPSLSLSPPLSLSRLGVSSGAAGGGAVP